MVVVVAAGIHDPTAVPEGRAPSAPILVGLVFVKDKPAPLHFRIAQGRAAATRHLVLAQREIHVFRGIAVQIIDLQGTVAVGKRTGGEGVGAALRPTSSSTLGTLFAGSRTDASLIGGAIAPGLAHGIDLVM